MDHQTTVAKAIAHGWQRIFSSPWLLGTLPLLVLGLLIWVFFVYGPVGVFRAAVPAQEEITIDRVELGSPEELKVTVTNTGPESVTIAQVMVNDAFQLLPSDNGFHLSRFERSSITMMYPWVQAEPVEVTLLTSTGQTFSKAIDVARETPVISGRYFRAFTLLGLYAGLIPVFVGLLWLPFVRQLDRQWLEFLLALTAGLLLFLGVDAMAEALALGQREVPSVFQGTSIVLIGGLLAFLLPGLLAQRSTQGVSPLQVSYFIALGIGLHNLGEGLAIGTAYAFGNVALGSLFVVGFMAHNFTEGLAIVAPASGTQTRLYHFGLMGLLAGGPTVLGAWIGGFTSSAPLSTLFLALGAGAIFQVLYQLGKLILRDRQPGGSHVVAGFLLGLAVLYLTGLLIVA